MENPTCRKCTKELDKRFFRSSRYTNTGKHDVCRDCESIQGRSFMKYKKYKGTLNQANPTLPLDSK